MSTNLTKREIVLEIYEKTGFPQKQIQDTVQMTLDIVMDALAAGRNVELRNFGVLEVQVRKARVGRNPNKPETEVIIPERAVVKFKSGKILKQKIKQLSLEKLKNNHIDHIHVYGKDISMRLTGKHETSSFLCQ